MSTEKAKNAASLRAIEYIKEGMTVGLGTGSTASYFIRHLIKKYKRGCKIRVVATSLESEKTAREGGIPITDINNITHLDLTVDGADEIDPEKRLIKGAGGALVREKIVAAMSTKMIVIADESKCVKSLGRCGLPVEVVSFGLTSTKTLIEKLGVTGRFRKDSKGNFYQTDNHNKIFDVAFDTLPKNPEDLHRKLLEIPGVVDSGFFFNLASIIIVGHPDETTSIII